VPVATCYELQPAATINRLLGCGIGLLRFWRRSDLAISSPVASLPDEKDKGRDQPNDDEHPVLAFETQKGEMLDEKLHRSRSLFVQDRQFSSKNILFLYFLWSGDLGLQSIPAGFDTAPRAKAYAQARFFGVTIAIEVQG
jgi:hypothetical protein